MKALSVYGGWDGHEPSQVCQTLGGALKQNGFDVEQADTLDVLLERGRIMDLDLIVPLWTAGEISDPQWKGLNEAVHSGVGITGQHRGMGDAFRMNAEYQFTVGGQFVAHPGDIVDYRMHIVDHADPITADLDDF